MSKTGGEGDHEAAQQPADRPRRTVSAQRLNDVFGDVLPDTTSDERDPGSSESASRDEWFEANRPPHH